MHEYLSIFVFDIVEFYWFLNGDKNVVIEFVKC